MFPPLVLRISQRRLTAGPHGLFLLHLCYADLVAGPNRLARTRAQSFADPHTSPHQRVSDRDFTVMLQTIAQLPRRHQPITMDAPRSASGSHGSSSTACSAKTKPTSSISLYPVTSYGSVALCSTRSV